MAAVDMHSKAGMASRKRASISLRMLLRSGRARQPWQIQRSHAARRSHALHVNPYASAAPLPLGKWDAAQKVAKGFLPPAELQRFNGARAREAEAAGAWKEAERCYMAASELEAAVHMYTKRQ